MSVAFQKIISPSSATFPGRRGIRSGLFSPSLSLCSPLMPPNKPGRDIIILEPGVAAGRTPGAGSSVCERVYVRFLCIRARARQPGSLRPHHHRVSQPQPVQTCTLSCQAQRTFPISRARHRSLGLGIQEGDASADISLDTVSGSTHLDFSVLKYRNCVVVFQIQR